MWWSRNTTGRIAKAEGFSRDSNYACTLHKKNHTSYREIAYASETSEVTIRNIYKILTEKLNLKEPVTLEILRETEEKKQAYLKKRFAKNRKT